MNSILLSIKPEYAEKIFAGIKTYEYRRKIFKDGSVKTVVVYVTSPIKKIIGEFSIEKVLSDTPQNIWKQTKDNSGITKEFYDKYFHNRDKAYAIKIKSVNKYKKPMELKDFYISSAPQSFIYLV
ncbi:ASCH domain-containing protein [Treponema sp.]|uniref:ASCH domain-containing protein n=1 Tax=Treponema sp. TaxID=166 RepID=UPI003FD7F7F6